MPRPTLIVFARSPAIGVGKTRLARDIGAVEAWRVYRAMSARVLWAVRDSRWRTVLCLEGRRLDSAWPKLTVDRQERGDLGQRLARAMRAHSRHGVTVIGVDVPAVTRARIAAAFRARNAIGPATDGGFWLLALDPRRARSVRLDGIRWSSADTLADTVAVLGRLDVLETLTDVDDAASLTAATGRAGSR